MGGTRETSTQRRRIGWRAAFAGAAACVAVAALAAGGAFTPVRGQEPAAADSGRVIPDPNGSAAIRGDAGGSTSGTTASTAGGSTNAEAVTTEDGRYCAHLQAKVAQVEQDTLQPPLQEAVSLSAEGTRLCEEGNVRGGIRRLRRALVLMMHAQNAAPDGGAASTLPDSAPRP